MTPRKRFALVVPQGLGDSLEATPIVHRLRNAHPDADITVIVLRPAARLLFADMPELVDRVVYLPYWERGAIAFALRALRLPFLGRFDACFLTYPAARLEYTLLVCLLRTENVYVHDYPAVRMLVRTMGASPVAIGAKHNVLRNDDLFRAALQAGCIRSAAVMPTTYSVPKSWRTSHKCERRVILHIGSIAHDGFDSKRWPEESFVGLGRRLLCRGFELAFLSGPDEREATLRVRAAISSTSHVIQGSLPEVARAISQAALVVANDNGIAHLAAGVGTPVIALFGPTPIEGGPWGHNVVSLRPSSCPPCFSPLQTGIRCALGIDFACLHSDFPVALVEQAVVALLARV